MTPSIGVIFATINFVLIIFLIVVIKRKNVDKPASNHLPVNEPIPQHLHSKYLVNDQSVKHLQDIHNILADISFKPSCVDMNWKWECCAVNDPPGYMIRTCFRRPERKTGKIDEGFGRWWFVPDGVSLSGVVKTAYKAAMLILEHELMESFKFRGRRIFNPHNTVEKLASIDESVNEE